MSIVSHTIACDWPNCTATVTIDPRRTCPLHDADWEGRGYPEHFGSNCWHACPVHRFKSTEEFRAEIERDRERGEYLG